MDNTMLPNSYQNPNWLVDELMQWLEPNEWVALSFMVRHILGWRDKISDRRNRISLTQFEDGMGDGLGGCGLTRPQIVKALNGLVTYRIVGRAGKPTRDGQEWELFDHPDVDYEGLKARKEAKAARGKRRVKKAAQASAEARKNETSGTPDVPRTSTPDVPAQQYDRRTPSGTSDVPKTSTTNVHTKPNTKPNVVVGDQQIDSDQDIQQQREPVALERELFEQHHIAEAIWRLWMRQDAVTVVAAILHATQSAGVNNPIGLMRAMLERGTSAPAAEFIHAARGKLGGRDERDEYLDALEKAGWDPRRINSGGNNGRMHS